MNVTAVQPNVAAEAADALLELGREDLAGRLRIAAARASRPATIVCIVGEFKQGKSSLVNALVGGEICPVDDDLATSALTLIRFADGISVRARRTEGDRAVLEEVPQQQIRDFVTEAGNPGNGRRVERLEIGIPSPLLQSGLVLVDTPGVGGLNAGQIAATLAFLPYADGLIFATDSTTELSAAEVDFLRRAVDACPTVLLALTKIDMGSAWRRIAALDEGHLQRAGMSIPMFPVSSALRQAAARLGDRTMAAESGVPALLAALEERILRPAKDVAAARARDEAAGAIDQVLPGLRSERAVLDDPSTLTETVAALEAAKARLEYLRGPGARWATLLGDRMSDLSNAAPHKFRGVMRELQRAYDARIEALKTPAEWEELGRALSADVAGAVADVFAELERGVEVLRQEVVDLLRDDSIELRQLGRRGEPVDVRALWTGVPVSAEANVASRTVGGALTSLRGAQSGILLLGLLGGLLPAAIGAVVLSVPVTLGLGAAFAGSQLRDSNRRKVEQRRQKVKIAIRQFMDDVQFQVGNEITESTRSFQRQLRDEFSDRAAELQRTYAETLRRAQDDAGRDEGERTERAAVLRRSIDRLEALRAGLVHDA